MAKPLAEFPKINGNRLAECKECVTGRHHEVVAARRIIHRPVADQIARVKAFLHLRHRGLSHEEALAKVNDVYK